MWRRADTQQGPRNPGKKLFKLHHHTVTHISTPTAMHHPLHMAATSPHGHLMAIHSLVRLYTDVVSVLVTVVGKGASKFK